MAEKDRKSSARKPAKKAAPKRKAAAPKKTAKPAPGAAIDAPDYLGRVPGLTRPKQHETLAINSHRELAINSKEIEARVAQDPEFSVMFLANPVLTLEAYGVKLSPEMKHHVLSSLRHPAALQERRTALESSLEKELGEPARPTDAAWMANLVFRTRQLAPRQIGKQEPAYRAPLNAKTIERLQKARPKGGARYATERRLPVRFSLKIEKPRSAIRRMDLDAELPELKPAARAPKSLSLEQAWFYKDDPIVRDAVELGQIMRRGFPFRTPAEFRKIEAGEMVDGFRKFVRGVTVKQFPRTKPQ